MSKPLTIKQEAFCQAYIKLGDVYAAAKETDFDLKTEYGSKYYVYLLVNPINDGIFYIGKGKNKRAEDHLKENKKGCVINAKKHSVINEILKRGLEPIILIFQQNLDEPEALCLEKILIELLKENITNKSKGFLDKHSRNKQKAISIQRRIIPYHTWLSIRPRTEFEKQLYINCVKTINNVVDGTEKIYDTIIIKNIKGEKQLIID